MIELKRGNVKIM